MNTKLLIETATIVLLALGAGNMIFAVLKVRQVLKLKQETSDNRSWQIVLYLIFFFLAAYLTSIVIVLFGSTDILLISSGIILLFEAIFIYRMSTVSYKAIQDLTSKTGELQVEQVNQEGRVSARISKLKAINEVGRMASSILDPQILMAEVSNLINDLFGYYYTAIFLVDKSGGWADLHYATGEAGRVLRENHHRLEVGGKSMVGMAVSTQHARIANNVSDETVRYQNPLLPYTRSELALPLIVGENVLGVLDVQATHEGIFNPQEVEILHTLAGQIAISIENARRFQNSQISLEELRAAQKQYVHSSWKPLVEGQDFEYIVSAEDLITNENKLEIPIALRDEIIGRINLAGEGEWTTEQRSVIEAVATQAALALENARLVEESQSSAARDRLLAEITGKIWTSPTIEGILQVAVRELGSALEVSDATIELRVEE